LSSRNSSEHQPVDLAKLLGQALERDQPRIIAGKIEVVRDFKDSGLMVDGDAKQLEIALANILKNAIDALLATHESKLRRIRVATENQVSRVIVEIEDSGPGIVKADLSRLFDPSFSTKGSAGMGIGLFLAREVLRLHGAQVEVQSREGEGARFRLIFPVPAVGG
jgi:signal transduction histidine kinase